ncbi:MAG TPA: OsmC family protein [Terriglobales bacterium]|nr:OsmC family protein [Terriglobales bacterium]
MSEPSTNPAASTTTRASLELESVEGGGLRFAGEVGGHRLGFDSGPGAASANPVQTVLAALGACTAMDVISILRKKRQHVTGYRVEVNGERRMDEHPKIYTHIEIVHRVWGRDVSPEAVADAVHLSDTKYCSVHAMLEGTVEITSRFEVFND